MQDNNLVSNSELSTSKTTMHESVAPNAKQLLSLYLVRLGKIFSNISIVAALLAMGSFMSFALVAIYFAVGLVVILVLTICTFGLIYIAWPGMWSVFVAGGQTISSISAALMQQLPVLLPICLIAAALSIICLWSDRHTLSAVRIYISFALLAIALLGVILLIGGIIVSA